MRTDLTLVLIAVLGVSSAAAEAADKPKRVSANVDPRKAIVVGQTDATLKGTIGRNTTSPLKDLRLFELGTELGKIQLEKGAYWFFNEIPAGQYTLVARYDGWQVRVVDFDAPAGSLVDLGTIEAIRENVLGPGPVPSSIDRIIFPGGMWKIDVRQVCSEAAPESVTEVLRAALLPRDSPLAAFRVRYPSLYESRQDQILACGIERIRESDQEARDRQQARERVGNLIMRKLQAPEAIPSVALPQGFDATHKALPSLPR